MASASGAFVIAVDGPAASGKGTVAQRLAEDYGYHYEAGERNEGLCAREFHWFLFTYNAPNGDCVNINIFGTSGNGSS